MRARAGAALALLAERALAARPPGGPERWTRTNHRGAQVSLLSGPALALAAAATVGHPAGCVAAAGAGIVGAYDDAAGGPGAKGLRGHLSALRRGEVTTGAVKIGGLAVTGVLAAATLRPRRPTDLLLGGAVVAGTANLVNLLDLRPGRALKAGGALALLTGSTGPAGACAALLPGDLRERSMLGDCGANALGAVVGASVIRHARGRRTRTAALLVLTGLTAASEVVSYSEVIDRTPWLRRLDRLGRRP